MNVVADATPAQADAYVSGADRLRKIADYVDELDKFAASCEALVRDIADLRPEGDVPLWITSLIRRANDILGWEYNVRG